MQQLQKASVAVLMLALAGGCNQSKMFGRIIGFVVNGATGQRLNAFPASNNLANLGNDANATNAVFALVEGRFKRAEPCGQGDANASNQIAADGCFRIEAVPVNTDVPIFAQFDGFERFHGKTRIVSNAFETTDLIDTDPQRVGNIMLWPLGFSEDYFFNVVATSPSGANRPVANAQINCQSDPSGNSFQTNGNDFITPEQTTLETVRAVSAADGTATIPGAQLVNGASYHCEVFVTDEFEGRTAQGSSNFTAGVTQPIQVVQLSLGGEPQVLYAVRSNNDVSTAILGASATLVVTFNRPAEIFPSTEDCQTAAISAPDTDGDTAPTPVFPADVINTNTVSERVNATFSTDGLTLTISPKPFSSGALDSGDLGATLSFSGIIIQPRDLAVQQGSTVFIGNATGSGSNKCTYGANHGTINELQNSRTGGAQNSVLRLF